MVGELSVAGRYAVELTPVGQGYALSSLTHVASGTRLLDRPLDLFEVERDGRWVGTRELAAEVVVEARPETDGRRPAAAQMVFHDDPAGLALALAVGATAEGALSLAVGFDGAPRSVRVRFPLVAALAARAAPDSRAAVALHDPEFRGLAGGRTDGAVFVPGRPRIALWRTQFFPTGTALHLKAMEDGPDACLWLSRYSEDLAADFVRGRAPHTTFSLDGQESDPERTLELTVGEAAGGWRAWLADHRRRFLAGLDLSLYQREDLQWLRRCFVAGYLFCYEHDFYDERRGGYRYHEWFARAERELGNFDLIMLCQGSPRIGIDDRNQHDLHRDVPGGLAALRAFVEEAHRHGSRVVYDYRPWDTCTRQSTYPADHVAGLEELLRETDMDGAFIDTGYWVPPGFREAADAIRPGIGFTSEGPPPTKEDLEEHLSSWAQRGRDVYEPALFIDGLKYILPLHNVHLASRWSRNHHRLLAQALFNGQGFYVWEPHYGSWTVWGPASRAVAKRCGAILRANADAFSSLEWEPLVPTLHPGVYANRWPAGGKELFTLLAVADVPTDAPVLAVPHRPGVRYVDLWNRRELAPEVVAGEARLPVPLALDVPACIGVFPHLLATTRGPAGLEVRLTAPPPAVSVRAELVTADAAAPLPVEGTGDDAWRVPLGEAVDLDAARLVVEALDAAGNLIDVTTVGGAALPANFAPRDVPDGDGGENLFEVARKISPRAPAQGRGGSGDEAAGMVQVPGGPYRLVVESCDKPEPFACYHPDENYTAPVELRSFLIDRYPVTNSQFKRFLDVNGYRPADPTNFLKHWGDGTYPPEKADHPVVYVNIDDARAFAAWAGKRLPTEAEWQCAAQSGDRRRWPWGNVYEPWRCNGEGRETTPVQAFPDGASPYGCLDLCGNVWELTDDQYDDGHHYYLILKGGSFYRIDERGLDDHQWIYTRRWPLPRAAAGRYRTGFYRQGGAQPVTHHLRFLGMGAALDRGKTIGFRCVRDL